MELRHLKFFLAVAHEGNITKAAEIIHTSQPNLSRQLQELEEELNTKLFNRGKTITLTENGELLKRRAKEILALTEKAQNEISSSSENLTGTISIGIGEYKPVQTIFKIIQKFKKQFPNINFDIFTGTSDQIKEQMEKGLLDIGLLLEPVEIQKYDFFRVNKKVRFVAVMKKNQKLARKKFLTKEDLKNLELIFPSRKTIQSELLSWFGENIENLKISATSNLSTNSAILVQNDLGIALTSEGISTPLDSKNDSKSQLVSIPLKPEIYLSAVIAWKKSTALSPSTKTFINFAKSAKEI